MDFQKKGSQGDIESSRDPLCTGIILEVETEISDVKYFFSTMNHYIRAKLCGCVSLFEKRKEKTNSQI